VGPSGVHLSSERRDGLSIYRILEQHQVVIISPLCGITDRTIPVEDTDSDQMDTLEDDILSDQMDRSDDDMQSDQMNSLEDDPLARGVEYT
jgi:hypothetical protein